MRTDTGNTVKNGMRAVAFVVLTLIGFAVALVGFMFSVFLNFVFPPILGPLLQGGAELLQLAGAQMITQSNPTQKSLFAVTASVVAPIALLVAPKIVKISLIGVKGYVAVALLMVPVVIIVSVFVSRIPRNIYRIVAGVLIMIAGMIVPALLASCLSRDLL